MELNHEPNTPPNRRDFLTSGVAGAAALAFLSLKGTVLAQNMIDDTPSLTEGPYWVDELLNRSDVRSDPTTGVVQSGLPTALAVNVSQLNADGTVSPLSGAVVDIWHCNALGIYSDMAVEGTLGQKFLRGYQVSNSRGNVRFYSIYPGWYSGRTTHIHAQVRTYQADGTTVTYNFATQFFFDDTVTDDVYTYVAPYVARPGRDTNNAIDAIYHGGSNDGTPASNAGTYLMLRLFENRSRATASFNIVLDLTNEANEVGGAPGGGMLPPDGGGGVPPDGTFPPTGGTPPTGPPPNGGTGIPPTP
ncbi:hypothetical protein EP7_001612 [Isosphaeraceae bacterium EP7]